jgi:hypothetical protein
MGHGIEDSAEMGNGIEDIQCSPKGEPRFSGQTEPQIYTPLEIQTTHNQLADTQGKKDEVQANNGLIGYEFDYLFGVVSQGIDIGTNGDNRQTNTEMRNTAAISDFPHVQNGTEQSITTQQQLNAQRQGFHDIFIGQSNFSGQPITSFHDFADNFISNNNGNLALLGFME